MPDEKDKKDEGYKPEFDIVEEGEDKGKVDDEADKGKQAKSDYADDERLSASQREDDDEHDDDVAKVEPDKGGETAEQIEAKRERRRRERRAQKARQNAARERDAREMQFLRTRNEQLERNFGKLEQRVSQNEMSQVTGRLEQLKATRDEAEDLLAKAIEANSGADVVKLQRTIKELDAGMARLNAYKSTLEKDTTTDDADDKGGGEDDDQQNRRQQQIRVPPSVAKNIEVFASRHPWFKPKSADEDSRIVEALDAAVLSEGYDPSTKDYWVELEDRMSRRLPERMKAFKKGAADADDDDLDDDDEPTPRRNGNGGGKKPAGGPRMASGSQNRGTGKQFMLSAARKQAMIEAGVWDDLKLRDQYIASYAQWDKDHPESAGR